MACVCVCGLRAEVEDFTHRNVPGLKESHKNVKLNIKVIALKELLPFWSNLESVLMRDLIQCREPACNNFLSRLRLQTLDDNITEMWR